MSRDYPSLGALPDKRSPEDFIYLATSTVYDLPAKIDNREECTPTPDQLHEGTCTGQAGKKMMEFLYWKHKGTKLDLSARLAYWNARLFDDYPGEDYEGSTLKGLWKGIDKRGICVAELCPYIEFDPDPPSLKAQCEARSRRGIIYERLESHNAMKHAIHQHGIIGVTAGVHPGWIQTTSTGKIKWGPSYTIDGYHAINCVGYDEVIGYWIIWNSWAEKWGLNGFGLWKYDDAMANKIDAWAVTLEV